MHGSTCNGGRWNRDTAASPPQAAFSSTSSERRRRWPGSNGRRYYSSRQDEQVQEQYSRRDDLHENMIQRYLIAIAKEKYRAADHSFRLSFYHFCATRESSPCCFPLVAHNARPFSELAKQIGSNVLMSDVIGLIAGVTDLLPPTGNA